MSKKQTITLLALGAVALAIGAFVEGRTKSAKAKLANSVAEKPVVANSSEVKNPSKAPVSSQGNSSSRIESALITLRPDGFEPNEITRPKGRLLLLVDNRSGSTEMWLSLDRLTGHRIHEVRVPHETLDWHELINLTPGEYVLTERHHPEWTCHITVTPR